MDGVPPRRGAGEAPISKKIARRILREFRVEPDGQTTATAASYPSHTKRLARSPRPVQTGQAAPGAKSAPDGAADQDGVLSERECEILRWVSKGASNKEIAQELFISENTVKNHLKNILAKLHLRNRVQLATYAVRQGMNDE